MNDMIKTIQKLRTIRRNNFSNRHIDDEDFELITNSCVRAANASARQSYSIIIVDDDIKLQLKWPGNKSVLFCVDFNRLIREADKLNLDCDFSYLLPLITGIIDTSLAAQTAVIAAKSLGIDSLITNDVYIRELDELCDLLELPNKHCFPLLAVSFGYPKAEPDHIKGRLAGPGVIHRGKYHRPTEQELNEIISCYDDPEKHMGLINNWEELGFKHYLEWFFKRWINVQETRDRSRTIYDFLKRQGFI